MGLIKGMDRETGTRLFVVSSNLGERGIRATPFSSDSDQPFSTSKLDQRPSTAMSTTHSSFSVTAFRFSDPQSREKILLPRNPGKSLDLQIAKPIRKAFNIPEPTRIKIYFMGQKGFAHRAYADDILAQEMAEVDRLSPTGADLFLCVVENGQHSKEEVEEVLQDIINYDLKELRLKRALERMSMSTEIKTTDQQIQTDLGDADRKEPAHTTTADNLEQLRVKSVMVRLSISPVQNVEITPDIKGHQQAQTEQSTRADQQTQTESDDEEIAQADAQYEEDEDDEDWRKIGASDD
jgi:hypothetical protein